MGRNPCILKLTSRTVPPFACSSAMAIASATDSFAASAALRSGLVASPASASLGPCAAAGIGHAPSRAKLSARAMGLLSVMGASDAAQAEGAQADQSRSQEPRLDSEM